MKVALVGRNEARLGGFPSGDPSWSRWGLAWDTHMGDHCDVLFDIHKHYWAPGTGSLLFSPGFNRPVYLAEAHPKVPTSIRFPYEDVRSSVTPYLESSIAYMFALAIHQGATAIGLWGISMNGTGEYAYQRPNMEYLIGLAHGRGIEVIQGGEQRRPGFLISAFPQGRYGQLRISELPKPERDRVIDPTKL